ncbi:MAG TPA: cache domain-containing protein, partial [Anaeromyxobacteraceae bacterium]|nr:cache domain-containing protein [Anaeromyxobacteraceae bacterium]
ADVSLTCFLRVHRPELHGDVLERPTARKAAETGQLVAGMDLGRTAFALRVVRPYYDGARLIGYMELAEEIDHFLRRLKEGTGDDFGLLVKKQYLDRAAWEAMQAPRRSTWDDRRDVVLVDATSYGQGIIDYQGDLDGVPPRGRVLEETFDGGRSFIRGIFPVDDVAGRRVGALFVRHEITALHQAIEASRLQGRLAVFAAALLLAVCLFLVLDAMVLRRAIRLSRLSQRLSERLPSERFGAGTEVITASEDELTRLEDFFRRFSRALGEDEGKKAPTPKR